MSQRGRATLLLWLALIAIAAWQAVRTPIRTDLSVFLPRSPAIEQQILIEQLRAGALARLVLVGIEGGSAEERAQASRSLAEVLRADAQYTQVANGDGQSLQADRAFVFRQRYLLSPTVDAARFSVDGLRAAISGTIEAVAAPAGMLAASLLPRDPTGETLQLIDTLSGPVSPRREAGVWASRTGERALLMVALRAPLIESDAQQRALATLDERFAALKRPELRLLKTGPAVFAAESRQRIITEAAALSALSTVLVVALLWFAYRSVRTLLLGLVPVACGVLAGFAAVGAGFGYVHGVTLAFGVTMIGEAVDYAVYLFVQAEGGNDPATAAGWQQRLWPTLRLGMATSIAGFGVLLLSGFPGLAQPGLFAIVGLVAAAIATRYGLPLLVPHGFKLRDLSVVGARLEAGMQGLARRRRWIWVPCLAAVAIIVWKGDRLWQRELTALSPVPIEARQLDAALRADLGAPDVRYVVAVPASDREAALRGAEASVARLAPLVEQGLLSHVDSPTRFLPSAATQRERQAALPPATELQSRLHLALDGLPLRPEKLQGFVEDVERARQEPLLTPESLAGTSLVLALQSLLVERDAPTANRARLARAAATARADLRSDRRRSAPRGTRRSRCRRPRATAARHEGGDRHDVCRLPARGRLAVRRRRPGHRAAAGRKPAQPAAPGAGRLAARRGRAVCRGRPARSRRAVDAAAPGRPVARCCRGLELLTAVRPPQSPRPGDHSGGIDTHAGFRCARRRNDLADVRRTGVLQRSGAWHDRQHGGAGRRACVRVLGRTGAALAS